MKSIYIEIQNLPAECLPIFTIYTAAAPLVHCIAVFCFNQGGSTLVLMYRNKWPHFSGITITNML